MEAPSSVHHNVPETGEVKEEDVGLQYQCNQLPRKTRLRVVFKQDLSREEMEEDDESTYFTYTCDPTFGHSGSNKSVSENTDRVIDNSVAVLYEYTHMQNMSLSEVYQLPQSEVDKLLRRFYTDVRKCKVSFNLYETSVVDRMCDRNSLTFTNERSFLYRNN